MTTYDKWAGYVYATLAGAASIANFIFGEWLVGALFASMAFGYLLDCMQKREIAELREDLDLALKREREHIKRYARAEAKVAYHEHLRKQRRDAIVDGLDEPLKSDLRETFDNLDAIRGGAK